MTDHDGLADQVVHAVVALAADHRPVVVGLTGAVAAGKSTIAADLASRLETRGRTVEVVATDAFLLPNAEIDARGLTMQKGYPASFDVAAMVCFVEALREGRRPLTLPRYSHEVYDRVPGEEHEVGDVDVVLLEGVNALQQPLADALHLALYLDADEADVEAWFVHRFLGLCAQAATDETSFYRRFVDADEDGRRTIAEAVWEGINLPNLRAHIAPTRSRADLVLRKGSDHRLLSVDPCG